MTGIMLQGAILVIAILVIQTVLGSRLHVYVRYGLWLVVALRLLIPVNLVDSPLSVLRLTERMAGTKESLSDFRGGTDTGADTVNAYGQAYTGAPQTKEAYSEPAGADSHVQAGTGGSSAAARTVRTVMSGLRVIWIAGSVLVCIVLGLSQMRFSRRLYKARVICEDCKDAVLPVYRVKGLESPCLAGLFHPAVCIGENIAGDSDYFRYAVAHEEVHYLHWDHIWALVRSALVAVYWFHPFVWVAAVCSVRDAELACDYGTVQRLGAGERFAYGEMLLALSSAKRGKKAYTFGMMLKPGKGELKERIQRLMGTGKSRAWASILAATLMIGISGCAFTGASKEAAAGETVLPAETKTAVEEKTKEDEAMADAGAETADNEKEPTDGSTQLDEARAALREQEDALLAQEAQLEQAAGTLSADRYQEQLLQIKEGKERVAQARAQLDDEETRLADVREQMAASREELEEKEKESIAAQKVIDEQTAEQTGNNERIRYAEPCAYTSISDTFGERINPATNEVRKHDGIDYVASKGADITAAADGTVEETGFSADDGNYVVLLHADGSRTYYCHCADILVENGMQVKCGDKIATVGSTGRSTGAHLHFALMNGDGEFVDPLKYIE